jgi:hypothetical protein
MINPDLISRLLAVDVLVCTFLEDFPSQRDALRSKIDDLLNQHVQDLSDQVELQLMANKRISNIYSQLKDNKNA